MRPRIGELRHSITIQEKIVSKDAMGAKTVDWDDFLIVYAKISPIRGREFVELYQKQSDITHRIMIRYQRSINTKHRIKFGDRIFDIMAIINHDERNIYQEILARESNV